MVDNIRAITEIYLSPPFTDSLNTIMGMINLWGMKLLRCKSNSNKVRVSIPSKVFKRLFGENPRVKDYDLPKNTNVFMKKIIVVEVITNDKNKWTKSDKNTKSKKR